MKKLIFLINCIVVLDNFASMIGSSFKKKYKKKNFGKHQPAPHNQKDEAYNAKLSTIKENPDKLDLSSIYFTQLLQKNTAIPLKFVITQAATLDDLFDDKNGTMHTFSFTPDQIPHRPQSPLLDGFQIGHAHMNGACTTCGIVQTHTHFSKKTESHS